MMNFDGKDVQERFKKAFGKDISELTEEQVRWIVNVVKHCRGRCRSNAALNNYLNRNFTGYIFKEEQGEHDEYSHLTIVPKNAVRPNFGKPGVKPGVLIEREGQEVPEVSFEYD